MDPNQHTFLPTFLPNIHTNKTTKSTVERLTHSHHRLNITSKQTLLNIAATLSFQKKDGMNYFSHWCTHRWPIVQHLSYTRIVPNNTSPLSHNTFLIATCNTLPCVTQQQQSHPTHTINCHLIFFLVVLPREVWLWRWLLISQYQRQNHEYLNNQQKK